MREPIARCAVVLALVAASACGGPDIQRFVPADADRFARGYLELLRLGRVDEARSQLSAELQTPAVDSALHQVALILASPRPPDSLHVIGANTSVVFGGGRNVNLTYELRVGGRWVVANVSTHQVGSMRVVNGIHAIPVEQSLERANAFTLSGKSPAHYGVLLWALVNLGVVVLAIVRVARAQLRRKWAWILLALVAATTFSLNWTTGETSFSFLNVLFLGFAFAKTGPAAPWIMSVGVPLGALLSLRKAAHPEAAVFGVGRREPKPVEPVPPPAPEHSPEEWVLRALGTADDAGADVRQIRWYAAERTAFGVPAAALAAALDDLERAGRIRREGERWHLVAPAAAGAAPPEDLRPPGLPGDAAPGDR